MYRKITASLFTALLVLLAVAVTAQADEVKDPSQPIKNLQFQSADINSVLTFLADYGGVNVVVAPEVEGTVTIKLRDVHWRSAMEIIGRTYDLAVVEESDGYIRVLPAEQYRKEVMENEKHTAWGLMGIQERVDLVDGETHIDSEIGKGTAVTVTVPKK